MLQGGGTSASLSWLWLHGWAAFSPAAARGAEAPFGRSITSMHERVSFRLIRVIQVAVPDCVAATVSLPNASSRATAQDVHAMNKEGKQRSLPEAGGCSRRPKPQVAQGALAAAAPAKTCWHITNASTLSFRTTAFSLGSVPSSPHRLGRRSQCWPSCP